MSTYRSCLRTIRASALETMGYVWCRDCDVGYGMRNVGQVVGCLEGGMCLVLPCRVTQWKRSIPEWTLELAAQRCNGPDAAMEMWAHTRERGLCCLAPLRATAATAAAEHHSSVSAAPCTLKVERTSNPIHHQLIAVSLGTRSPAISNSTRLLRLSAPFSRPLLQVQKPYPIARREKTGVAHLSRKQCIWVHHLPVPSRLDASIWRRQPGPDTPAFQRKSSPSTLAILRASRTTKRPPAVGRDLTIGACVRVCARVCVCVRVSLVARLISSEAHLGRQGPCLRPLLL